MLRPGVFRRECDGSFLRISRLPSGWVLELLEPGRPAAEIDPRCCRAVWSEWGKNWGISTFEVGRFFGEEVLLETNEGRRITWRRVRAIDPLTEPQLFEGTASLDERGLGVVRGALSPEEVDAATEACWEYLEEFGILRDAPESWPEDPIGVLRWAGQCRGSWLVRGNRKVQAAFRDVWGTDDLITSMDSLFLWRPWKALDQRTLGGWLHRDDHDPVVNDRCTVQGVVALTAADDSTGGFVCCLDSHLDHTALGWRYVALEPGDLVLWDSRLYHASEPGCDASSYDPKSLLRLAVAVCMVPRAAADPATLRKRLDLFRCGGTTMHSPHKILDAQIHHRGDAPRVMSSVEDQLDPGMRRVL
ncbi:hypothetical protein CTAYLR_003448 [Chrysophaeum taylorii]|uniref:Phytanoyl-CoA dioxygenase n=1 Tax=Chrysophaeum taylorii TaxID=2483200 RepID=A0AAD7U8D4_9STRA|nr:hypothetical protein CTAYLR_003448 [Chrysophaeum taylorii]